MIVKHFLKTALVSVALIASVTGCNKDDDNNNPNTNGNLSTQDQMYMAMAQESNKAEIDAGQTASSKGDTSSVRSFGSYMVTEHTMSKNSLDSLASAIGFTFQDTLSAEHQAMKQMLANMSGHTFDSTYMTGQVNDHQKVITLMQNIMNNASSQGLKNYANRYLPHIQMHHMMADSIKNSL